MMLIQGNRSLRIKRKTLKEKLLKEVILNKNKITQTPIIIMEIRIKKQTQHHISNKTINRLHNNRRQVTHLKSNSNNKRKMTNKELQTSSRIYQKMNFYKIK